MTAFNAPIVRTNAAEFQAVGACAGKVSQIRQTSIANLVKDMSDDQDVIIVAGYMFDIMDDEELLSIIAHEQGHIVMKHNEGPIDPSQVVHVNGIDMYNVEQFELEADAYAAKLFGPRTMMNALGKIVDHLLNSGTIAAEMAKMGVKANAANMKLAQKHARKGIKPRMDALAAMM